MPEPAGYARSIPGVLFIEDFDLVDDGESRPAAGEIASKAEMAPAGPDPVDVAAIRTESFQEGFETGKKMIEEGMLTVRNDLLSKIEDQLRRTHDEMITTSESGMAAIAETVFTLLLQLFPAFCRSHGENEMRTALREMLPDLPNETRLTVCVHPSLIDAARDECSRIRTVVTPVVEARDNMMPGDIELAWQNGTLMRDMAKVSRSIIQSLNKIGLLHHEDKG